MHSDIAIIGIAGRFPGASSIDDFFQNLAQNRDLVRPLSIDRIRRTSIPLKNYQPFAYIDDIDFFDSEFFDISAAEAKNMDPSHRLLLEVAHEAIENSGQSPASLAGSNTGVFMSNSPTEYYRIAEEFDPTLVTGNMNSAIAGRISRVFDLRGPSLMIDSACSSSITALYYAFNELNAGRIDAALVGGANIVLFPEETDKVNKIGNESADGRCKAFSKYADGIGSGEAVCCLLLKPLDNAIRDENIIHGIIKTIVVNQNGALSASFTAPDVFTQQALITKAFQQASVHPDTITYYEAHGTGTKLGDPIEIEAITKAFRTQTQKKKYCAIGSVKSMVGHTNMVAGIVGLIKVALSLKNKLLFSTLHCEELNPFIDFDNSPLFVNRSCIPWNLPEGVTKRRAALSSFGLIGTNAHMILEEIAEPVETIIKSEEPPRLVVVSGKSKTSLQAGLLKLREFLLTKSGIKLSDVSRTLLNGRDHYQYRFQAVVSSNDELIRNIDSFVASEPTVAVKNLVLLLSGDQIIQRADLEALCVSLPGFRALLDSFVKLGGQPPLDNINVCLLTFYCTWYEFLRSTGLNFCASIGDGIGKLAAEVIAGRVQVSAAIPLVETYQRTNPVEKFNHAIQKIQSTGKTIFIECGMRGSFSRSAEKEQSEVLTLASLSFDSVLQFYKSLHRLGVTFNDSLGHLTRGARLITLPSYQFDRRRCWLRDAEPTDLSWPCFEIIKVPKAIEGRSPLSGTILTLNDGSYDFEILTGKLKDKQACTIIVVNNSTSLTRLDNGSFTADFSDAQQLACLRDDFLGPNVNIRSICYFASVKTDDYKNIEWKATRKYFEATKAFIGNSEEQINVITFVAKDKGEVSSVYSGFCVGLSADYPNAFISCVEYSQDTMLTPDKLVQEFSSPEEGGLALSFYQGSHRFVQDLQKIELSEKTVPAIFKSRNTYLITGGTSGIGFEVVKWLTAQTDANIAVIGRRTKAEAQKIFELNRYSRIHYYSVDLCDVKATREALKEITLRFGLLTGVFHCAGIPGSRFFQNHTWETFKRAIDVKASILEIVKHIELNTDSFTILFSSVNALHGAPRGVDYGVANAFLDNFANDAEQKVRVCSINWPSWRDVGMSHRVGELLTAGSITCAEGLATLERVLQLKQHQIIVTQNPVNKKAPKPPSDWEEGEIQVLLLRIWRDTIENEYISAADDFFDIGGHSLSGFKVLQRIEKHFGLKLELDDLLTNATAESMAKHIVTKYRITKKITNERDNTV